MPVGSKSTDKLVVMQKIIEDTLLQLGTVKQDQLKEIQIDWVEKGDCDDKQLLPTLKISFYE